jgi:hypothetical protein
MKKYTAILPVHKVDDEIVHYFRKAIESLVPSKESVDLIVVHTDIKDRDVLPTPAALGITTQWVLNEGPNDFCSQVNLGIDNVTSKWFSILEVDDSYSPKWFLNVDKYSEAYPEVDVFLPVVADVDEKDNFLSFTNETLWALGFSNVQGELDNEALLEFQNFQISGAVYNTEKVKKFGKLKNNIKLSFGYEFLLRLTQNNIKIMTIPKTGYKHTNMRTDSLFWKYKNDEASKISSDEAKFWMDAARKEFYFNEQRELNYTQ